MKREDIGVSCDWIEMRKRVDMSQGRGGQERVCEIRAKKVELGTTGAVDLVLNCVSGLKMISSGICFRRVKAGFKNLFSLQRNDKVLG